MEASHCLIDFWGAQRLAPDEWPTLLKRAVAAAGAELVDLKMQAFQPHGLTAFCLLAESHLAVHTWPERDYVAVDLFTCGDRVTPEKAVEVLQAALLPTSLAVHTIRRGQRHSAGSTHGTTTTHASAP